MEDNEEFEQEQTDYSLFLNKKNLNNVSKIIKGQFNESKNDLEKQETILTSLENLKNVISESHVVSSRNLSIAKWDYSLNLAIVTVKHGNLFETMGKVINGQLTLFPEETLFLIEKGSLLLIEENDNGEEYPISIQQAYSIIFSVPSFSFEKYRVYSYLKRLGYIILEHDSNTSSQINVEFNKNNGLNNIDNIKISNDKDNNNFSDYITGAIDYITDIQDKIGNSNLIPFSPLRFLFQKSFDIFNKLFTVPLSIGFNLETKSKVKYIDSKKEKTQPLYNYYDDKTLDNVYSKISIISYYNPSLNNQNNNHNNGNINSLAVTYDAYKPNGQYTKKKKSLPDFYIIVHSCLDNFPHFMEFMSIINERNNIYNANCNIASNSTSKLNNGNNNTTTTTITTTTTTITSNNNNNNNNSNNKSNNNSNKNNNSNSNNNKNNSNNNNKNNKKDKIEIKLALVNAANITFADIDNEYIRSLRK